MSGGRMSGGRMSGGRLSGGLMSGGLMSAHRAAHSVIHYGVQATCKLQVSQFPTIVRCQYNVHFTESLHPNHSWALT